MCSAQAMRSGRSLLGTLYIPAKNRGFRQPAGRCRGKTSATCSQLLAHRLRAWRNIDSRHARHAGRGPEQAAQDADGGGFARTVGAKEAEDFARARLEADVVDGDKGAEPLGQVLDHDGGFIWFMMHGR